MVKLRLPLLLMVAVLAGCAPQEPAAELREGLQNGAFDALVNGFNIHYQVRGRGPLCIALANSWGLTGDGVRAVLRPLEDQLTVVYFDPRGMGRSGPIRQDSDMSMKAVREDADGLREHLKVEKAIFVGWSNGAANLMIHAAEYPETVEAAIMLHGTAYFSPEDMAEAGKKYPDLFEKFMDFQQQMNSSEATGEEKNARVKQFNINEWFPYLFASRSFAEQRLPEMYAEVGFSWDHSAYANLEQQSFDARESLAQITAPCLVVAGAHDMLPPARIKEAADGIPDSTFHLFEGSAHFAPLEETELFMSRLSEFLQGIAASGIPNQP